MRQFGRLADAGNKQHVPRLLFKLDKRFLHRGKYAEVPATGAPGDGVGAFKIGLHHEFSCFFYSHSRDGSGERALKLFIK